jgi:hypothetical protein
MVKSMHTRSLQGSIGSPTFCLFLLLIAPALFLAACAPYRYSTVQVETDQAPPPPTEVFFYPNQGQPPEQQDRDSYECYLWAEEQTGFDPSSPGLAPHHKLAVVPEIPPGTDTAVGAVTGAILGASVASRGKGPEGALVGAVAGAILGSASDAARQEEAYRMQSYYDRQAAKHTADIERQASQYRRAISACLEGRGYTVR